MVKTVLIVDDEPGILEVTGKILADAGYAVIAKHSAEEALKVIKEGTPIDLAITDNRLPGMQGTDFASELRRLSPRTPVIMLTAHGSVETYIQSMTRGVFEYVNKPFHAKELRRIVKAALEWSEQQPAERSSGNVFQA